LGIVLSYPLTPVLLCFGQVDGTINKTNKATLLNLLEKKTSCHQPRFIEAYVVDGYFFLHLMKDLPSMWSRAAREILLRLCRFPARRIDLVFDLVSSPSIKDCERDRRSNEERSAPFRIFGPNQHRPQDFIKSLRNDNFKREIVRFLVESWSDDSLASILGDKVVHITHESFCYRLQVINDKVTMSQIDDLTSEHEEADTRMMAHVASIPSPSTVVVRTCDTDVLVVATGNALELGQNKKVYLEIGIQSKNTLKFIDVTALAKKLGPTVASALPAFHAYLPDAIIILILPVKGK